MRADPDELLKRGIYALQQKNFLAALAYFERAYTSRKTPLTASYYGLCLATERGKVSEAIALCEGAIAQEPHEPRHYLNLAKVYLKADRKVDCLETLRKGLAQGDEPEIRQLLGTIGVRKPPVFAFLPRGHFLNRYIGLVLSRLRLR
ncbi:MAG TPA: tetratricopeptide repeat protein [Thermodesulfovibrionales bacterium]|nr:tetratricopeptide repeat protein [Thermodesulfovibrionales bacterium]